MDAEKAKPRVNLALILAIAGTVVALAAGAVLFLAPRSAGVNITLIILALLSGGAAFAGSHLSARAKGEILPGQAGRQAAEIGGTLGWVGVAAAGWVLLYLLALLAPQTEIQTLLGLGEVFQTLLIIVLVAVVISAYTYLLLGLVLSGPRWTLLLAILHLVSGALGLVAGVLALVRLLGWVLAPLRLDVASLEEQATGWGIVALVYGLAHAAIGLLLLLRRGGPAPWVRTVSALLNTAAVGYSLYLAGTALSQKAWAIFALALLSVLLGGLAISIGLPPSKTRYALPFVLLSPAIVGLCLLVVYPMGYEIRLAFSNMSLRYFKNPNYSLEQGWTNLKQIFTMPVLKRAYFFPVFLRTILWTGIQVPVHVFGGLVLALLLNRPMKMRGLYRALLVIPWALPPIVAVLAWRGEFHYEYGFINIMLQKIGLAAVQWKSDPTANFIAMNIVNIWLGIPFMMVILLGGLQSIPAELYEAAEIDGATWWQQFRRITWPLLQPVLTPAIVLGVIWTFNNFNVPFFINENELETSDILVTALFRAAFQYNQYGFAAAFALVIFVILLGFSVFYIYSTGALRGVTESAPTPRRRFRLSLRRGDEKGGSPK